MPTTTYPQVFIPYGYPPQYVGPQVAGNGTEGVFLPEQLWAGESDIVTTDETIAQYGPLPQFLVMGRRADGCLVPVVPASTDALEAEAASQTITFSAIPAVNDTVTIGGNVITFIANNAVPVGNQVPVGVNASGADTAEALVAFLSDNDATFAVQPELSESGLVVTLISDTPGTAGNSITLAKSSAAIAVGGATFAGGSATTTEQRPESVPVAVLATPVDTTGGNVQAPVYIDGVFNWLALVWPVGTTTLLQAKALTDRCRFSVKALK